MTEKVFDFDFYDISVSGVLFGLLILFLIVDKHALVRWWRSRVLGVVYSLPVPPGYGEVQSAYCLTHGRCVVGTRSGLMYYCAEDVCVHVDGELLSGWVEAISLLDCGKYSSGFWRDVSGNSHRGCVRVFVRSGACSFNSCVALVGN